MADGYIVYQGDAKKSPSYFSSIGLYCPTFANPADYYMKRLTVNYPKQEYDERKVKFLKSKYEEKLEMNLATEAALL
jgi:hypothetical protein